MPNAPIFYTDSVWFVPVEEHPVYKYSITCNAACVIVIVLKLYHGSDTTVVSITWTINTQLYKPYENVRAFHLNVYGFRCFLFKRFFNSVKIISGMPSIFVHLRRKQTHIHTHFSPLFLIEKILPMKLLLLLLIYCALYVALLAICN